MNAQTRRVIGCAVAARTCRSRPAPPAPAKAAATILSLLAMVLLALAPPPTLREVATLRPQAARIEPRFGRSVAVAGTAVIVASPADGDDGTAGGAVHVFGDSKSGWRRVQRLFANDQSAQDRFGQSVAADGARVVVGRDRADDVGPDAGAVMIFRRSGYHFRAEGDLFPSEPGASDGFGGAVAICGSTIVVGSSRDDHVAIDAGSAEVFRLSDGAWKLDTKLVAPDAASSDWFGHAVATSEERVAIGAYGDDDHGEKSGAVYLYERGGEGWRLDTKLAPEDTKPGDWFGFACALDRNMLAVGAPRDDGSGESAGCVRIYRRSPRGWVLEATLRPAEGSVTTWFGYALAFDHGRLLVGAPGDDANGAEAGAAYLYRREHEEWVVVARLVPSTPTAGEQFGASVALHEDLAVAGRNWDQDAEPVSGSAWVYRIGGSGSEEPASKPRTRGPGKASPPPPTLTPTAPQLPANLKPPSATPDTSEPRDRPSPSGASSSAGGPPNARSYGSPR